MFREGRVATYVVLGVAAVFGMVTLALMSASLFTYENVMIFVDGLDRLTH
ncbi:hypothetical protein SAMN04489726_0394 [Allokutzneria albata]|uniref:Uncharacterized protein n=2 Tax=Allokutzneria albata TaxID=211114 RepID=A0A1G9RDQ6_ALLAB|nr:hypothetical protein SAMN04489726_0394 [Allokutzneria albata]